MNFDKLELYQKNKCLKRINIPNFANKILIKIGNNSRPPSFYDLEHTEKIFSEVLSLYNFKIDIMVTHYQAKIPMQFKAEKVEKKEIFKSIPNTIPIILVGNNKFPATMEDLEFVKKESLKYHPQKERENKKIHYVIIHHLVEVYYNIDLFFDL